MEYDADIFDAVEFGDLDSVKRYWTKEINIDFQDDNGMSMIMLATRYNHIDIINHLLTLNPNLNLRNKEGETVFQMAERLKDPAILKTLVEFGRNNSRTD